MKHLCWILCVLIAVTLWAAGVASQAPAGSQRSPGFGLTSSLVKRAFSSVSRDLSSSTMRSLAMPKLSNSRAASSASVEPW